MPWRESFEPVRMQRVALLATREDLRDLLVTTADQGVVELDVFPEASGMTTASRLQARISSGRVVSPALTRSAPDLDALGDTADADLLAGEAQLQERAASGIVRGQVTAVAGWMPAARVPALAEALAASGGAVVRLPDPKGLDPPTQVHTRGDLNRSFAPLMDTYATVPYRDVDPTVVAGPRLRRHVRDDVRRRRARPPAAARGAPPAGWTAAAAGGRPPRVAVPRRSRHRRDLLRGAVRRVLRADRRPAGAVVQAAGGPDPAAGGGDRRRRPPPVRGLRDRHRQPLAGRGLAVRARRPHRARRRRAVPRVRPAAPRRLPGAQLAGRPRGGHRGGRVGADLHRRCSPRPAEADPASHRPGSSCSTASFGWAPTSSRSPGSLRSGWPMPRSGTSCGRARRHCGTPGA